MPRDTTDAPAYPRRRFHPLVAAGAAAFNALLLIGLLLASGSASRRPAPLEPERLRVRIVAQAPPTPPQPAPRALQAAPRRAPALAVPVERTAPGSTAMPAVVVAPPAEPPMAAASAAPAPLAIDIRRANEASHGAVTRLAQRANAPVQRDRVTAEDRLRQGMDAASIPDCLRPDALKHAPIHLGGLFDLPVLAYVAVTGQCKQ